MTGTVQALIPADVMGSFHLGDVWVRCYFELCWIQLVEWSWAWLLLCRRKTAGFVVPQQGRYEGHSHR